MSKSKLTKSSFVFSCLTLVSRIFGFMRDMLAASLFGAGAGYDAFVLAFRIPNLLRRFFAEGAFSQAFVPLLAQVEAENETEFQKFVNDSFGSLALVLLLVTSLGIFYSDLIIRFFAPGFKVGGYKFYTASIMLKITFPYIFFISLVALMGAVLQNRAKFAPTAFAPVLLNISLIASMLIGGKYFSMDEFSLAYGVLIAGFVQFIFILVITKKIIKISPSISFFNPKVKKLLTLIVPAVFGASIAQINLMVDSWFASFLTSGSISWLYYADRLMEFPLGVFGVAISTVLLPDLAKSYADNNNEKFKTSLSWGINAVTALGVPSAVGIYVLSPMLVTLLFHRGNFTNFDVDMTAKALQGYSLAIFSIMLAKNFSNAFYSIGDIKTPVKVSVLILITNCILNSLLVDDFGHIGLAISTSICSFLNLVILSSLWQRKSELSLNKSVFWFFIKVAFATSCMYVLLNFLTPSQKVFAQLSSSVAIMQTLGIITIGGIIYIICMMFFGVTPRSIMQR